MKTMCAVLLWFPLLSGADPAGSAAGDIIEAAAKTAMNKSGEVPNSEVARDLIIAAGKNAIIDSTLDYSSATIVAVTVQCSLCNTSATSLAASAISLQARWKVPDAESYVATESKLSSSFAYWDAGAALFTVFGSQFRLIIQNRGSQAIAIDQVTIFRRAP